MTVKDLNNLYIIYAWSKVGKKMRNLSIDGLPKCAIDDFCICFQDIIKGRVPLNKNQIAALLRYKKELRILASRKTPNSKKKKALKKKGLIEALTRKNGRSKKKKS